MEFDNCHSGTLHMKNSKRFYVKKTLKKLLLRLYKIMVRIFPLKKNKAMFMSNMGRNYSGNPRAVFEKMCEDPRFFKTKKIWAFNGDFFKNVKNQGKVLLPGGCRIVRYGGIRYYFHMATSGLWIFDTRQEPYLIKRKGSIYFQTWHGTPLKKLGLDIERMNMAGENRKITGYKTSVIEESAKWDYLLAQNDFCEELFPKCFGFKGKVVKAGYPRNDRLAAAKKEDDTDVGKRKKILLYAPTWRDNEYLGNGFYKFPSCLDFLKLQRELSDDFCIIVKPHYLVKIRKDDIPENCIKSGFIKICGNETDIRKLYLRADGLITDYSSVFFDYSVLERPVFFFCYDLETYRDELRGFYLDFEKIVPGPISKTEEELIKDIKDVFGNNGKDSPSFKAFKKKIESFKEWFNTYDDGHASERVLDVLAEERK